MAEMEDEADSMDLDFGDLPPPNPGLSHRAASINFTEQVVAGRENELRRHPWFRALPVRPILLTMYKSLASSSSMQPFQLIALGNMLLGLVTKLPKKQADKRKRLQDDQDLEKYLQILQLIFDRLKSFGDGNHEGQGSREDSKRFLDSVWELHTNGTLDLSKTNIPGIMVNSCPSKLDNVLVSCIGSGEQGSLCLTPLIPLCDRNPANFLFIMQHLRTKFFDHASPPRLSIQQNIIEFACKFQNQLRDTRREEYTRLLPSMFHPLVHVLFQILDSPWAETLLQNQLVIEELRNLVDQLSYQAELSKFNSCDLLFILRTIPYLPCDVIFNVKNSYSLWFKRCLKNSEIGSIIVN